MPLRRLQTVRAAGWLRSGARHTDRGALLFGPIPSQQVKISTPREDPQAKKRGKQPKKHVFSFFFAPLTEQILCISFGYFSSITLEKKKTFQPFSYYHRIILYLAACAARPRTADRRHNRSTPLLHSRAKRPAPAKRSVLHQRARVTRQP